MPEALQVGARVRIPASELQMSFARSSGPGGQNVNKVNSKAMLRWNARASGSLPADARERFLTRYRSRLTADGELILQSQRYRDQGRNTSDCLEKLRAMIAAVLAAPRKRRPTKVPRGAIEDRLQVKRRTAQKKQSRGCRTLGDD